MKLLSLFSAALLSLVVVPLASAVDNQTVTNKAKLEAVINQEVININTADVQTLTSLKGVGLKKAEAIVAWRETNGSFKSVEQLLDVKGIGEAIIEANRKNLRI